MKKPQIRFRSFYAKLVIMFLFMGLIPFLLMGMLIYNVYSNTMYAVSYTHLTLPTN